MDNEQLKKLLAKTENPKFEFKKQWYCGNEQLDDKGWGEFLKDIIALANGNVGYVGQTAYLIIGASDTDPEANHLRDTYHVDNCGMLSNIQKLHETTLRKLRETCSPSLSDIKIYFNSLETNKNLLIFEIPSPIDILKLDRDLNTRGMRFKKGTVLLRVGQDISVACPTEIITLKKEYASRYNNSREINKKILHNLPQPDYINFVGRKEELEQIRKLLQPQDRIWTIVIDGIGGIGKSALALEIAHRYKDEYEFLPEEERFDAIIWVSAKTSSLTAEGIKTRYQVTNTISDIYKEISIVLGKNEINLNSINNINDQNLLIKGALRQQRTLLIIDNFETIDDERVNSFIRELPSPTKSIVTTRHRIDIADPIRLSAMPREDAINLIKQECKKKDVQLKEEQAELLYKRTAGVPLAVVWSIAQISHHGFGIDKVLRSLGNAKGDIARFCFESAVQQIMQEPAYKLLVCISLSTSDLDREAIGYISDTSDLDRDEGLATLERLSLVNRRTNQQMQASYFSVLSLVKEYLFHDKPNLTFEDLKIIILRITNRYPPEGANAVALINRFFQIDTISPLKEEITNIVVHQMWEWDSQLDEQGVGYCMAALEKLATHEAIKNIKAITLNSNITFYQFGGEWIYLAGINALKNLGRVKELIELIVTEKKISYLIVDALKTFQLSNVTAEIDKLIESSSDEQIIILQQLKDLEPNSQLPTPNS
jgi:hypothetical protein